MQYFLYIEEKEGVLSYVVDVSSNGRLIGTKIYAKTLTELAGMVRGTKDVKYNFGENDLITTTPAPRIMHSVVIKPVGLEGLLEFKRLIMG